ncbi:MAG: hypothetical protein IJU47_06095 [Verrucomicrobia bacterium]|nr:hypothetical protein [Verrucomicrobiota bacterium]
MNAKVIVYLLISAFVLCGCTSYRTKNIAEKEALEAKFANDWAEAQQTFAQNEALMQKCNNEREEFEKYIDQFKKEQAECKAWIESLSPEHRAIISHELEEKQIRYNQIYGFNEDGSSHYVTSGTYWDDRLLLMQHYKPIWDNKH